MCFVGQFKSIDSQCNTVDAPIFLNNDYYYYNTLLFFDEKCAFARILF